MRPSDVRIDVALVERLVREQHPALLGPVRLLARGWDNDVYELGDRLLVRLPRRIEAAPLVENEQRWLRGLARRLPIAIPEPVAIGSPGAGYPWRWSIVRRLPGVPAADAGEPLDDLAEPLADVLRALHSAAPSDAPANPVRGVPLTSRDAAVRDRLASGLVPRADELTRMWERSLAAEPWRHPPVWLHGDLHPANVLVETRPLRLSALIDFGDLTAGDPATDLSAAWIFFDADGRSRFRARADAERDLGEDDWTRARGWALALATAYVTGSPPGSPMIPLGARTTARLLEQRR